MTKIPSEGVIKFKFNLKMTAPLEEKLYLKIEKWRAILFKMNLIGEYPTENVGFGNLSLRISPSTSEFVITGTQTGKYPHLNGSQYTRVSKCDLSKMTIEAIGPIAPSSESSTHYAIYQSSPQVSCIFHVHHNDLWNYMLKNGHERTPEGIDYGTHAMAMATQKCIGTKKQGIFAMAGHKDGIIAYGATPEDTGKIILDTLKESRN